MTEHIETLLGHGDGHLTTLAIAAAAKLLIALYRPFKPGDRLTISGESGKVLAINLRHSVLIDGDRRIFIPNTLILSDPLIVEPCATIPPAFQEK